MEATESRSEDVSLCLDRARVYRALAQLFRPPDAELVKEARERNLPELCGALERLVDDARLIADAKALRDLFDDISLDRLRGGYGAAFDESSGTRCSPTEMDQLGGPPQLELTRNFEMADVAGFYRAFGVEVGPSSERPDHVTAELEFMCLLAVKESIALQEEGPGEHAETCRSASRAFLRDHLGRFAPRLGAQLADTAADPVYATTGNLLADFVRFDARRIDAEGAAPRDRARSSA